MVATVCAAAAICMAGCGGGGSSGSRIASASAFAQRAQSRGLGCTDYKAVASSTSAAQFGTCTLTANLDEARCQRARKLDVEQQESALGTNCGASGESTSFAVFTPKSASKNIAYFEQATCHSQKLTGQTYYITRGQNWMVATNNAAIGILVGDKLGGSSGKPSC
ncbi:MAG TPA: hypothetical protein VIC35_13565 [Acidimicrobiia bacterium]